MKIDQLDSGIILHELSNIGMVIQSGAQMMEYSDPHSTASLTAARTVTHGAKRLKETLAALKILLGGHSSSEADCEQSMLSFVREFAGDSILWREKNKTVTVQADEDEPEVFAPELLRMVLRNLLANAISHSPAGSKIDVRIKHSATETRILVRNFGYRISDEVKACLFQPGCKGAGSSGSGLGLHIAHRCAQALGGDIRFKSSEYQTVFCLVLKTKRPKGAKAKKTIAA